MESKLNGLAISKGVSKDEVVRTIQALISAGYKGDELLEKIDEIYGVGARNNLLKTIDYEMPTERITVSIEYPQISPSEKTKIGDILIGSNGYIGEITDLENDSNNLVSSITVLGLSYNITENMLPDVSVEDNYKVLTVDNGAWSKNYISRTNKDFEIFGEDRDLGFEQGNLIFNNGYIDERIQEGITRRSISIEPVFVPYNSSDPTLLLRFSDDDDQLIRLSGIKDPVNNQDVANKKYVDNHTPLFIVFSGTTEKGNASCDTDWDTILSAINSERPIHARYLAKSQDDSNIYYDLSLNYSNAGLSGNYLFIEDLSNPMDSYEKIDIRIDNNILYIHFISV
jgi:hypothetical protein